MYVAVVMRTLFSVCVPLFMLLTGYLMSKKELSKKYYSGITKTLVVFVISTLACMIYKNIAQGDVFDLNLSYSERLILPVPTTPGTLKCT